jgi:hypothetical protein
VYWRCSPSVRSPFFTSPVDDQHGIRFAEVVDHELAQIGRDAVGVPHRPVQEVLHPARTDLTGVFGDRPAVLAGQLGKHAVQERGEPAPGLHPAEPRNRQNICPLASSAANPLSPNVWITSRAYCGEAANIAAASTALRPCTDASTIPARRNRTRSLAVLVILTRRCASSGSSARTNISGCPEPDIRSSGRRSHWWGRQVAQWLSFRPNY